MRPNGRPTRCLVSVIDGHWDVVVWNASSIAMWERFLSADEAERRADELWTMLVAYGCEPAGDLTQRGESAFVRCCAACARSEAAVSHRRHGYLVMRCGACGHAWNDKERSSQRDRRVSIRHTAVERRNLQPDSRR